MVLVPSVGQYIAMYAAARIRRRISQFADGRDRLRPADLSGRRPLQAGEGSLRSQNPRGMKRPEYDRALEGVIESKRILLPAQR